MVSITDVAKKANVSIGTASRALRNIGYISKDVKIRVMQAAQEIGYVPSFSAKQLKTNEKEKTVGIIINDLNNEYFIKVLSGLQKKLHDNHISLIVAFSSMNQEDEEKAFNYLISNRVAVIIFIPTTDQNSHILELAQKNEIQVLQLFLRVYKNYDAIINDDSYGCSLATKHLIQQGCKKLLLLDVVYFNYDTVEPRRSEGFYFEVRKNSNIAHHVLYLNPALDIEADLENAIQQFQPDGIIAGTGITGYKLLAYLQKKPYSTKIVSFDNNNWFDYLHIDTIKQHTDELVDYMVKYIIKPQNTTSFIKIKESLIVAEK